MPYKISGAQTHDCNVKIFQGDEYVGYTSVSGGSHDTIFDLTSSGVVTAVGEKTDGQIVGFGQVEPIYTASAVNINAAGGGAAIKSIQTVGMSMTAGQSAKTTSITAVDMDKTMLIFNGCKGEREELYNVSCHVRLTGTTTVEGRRWSTTGTCAAYATVVEFDSGINVQRGLIYCNQATSASDTITAVDTANSFVNFLGERTSQSVDSARAYHYLVLNNSTTVTAYRHEGPGSGGYISYEVIEFE